MKRELSGLARDVQPGAVVTGSSLCRIAISGADMSVHIWSILAGGGLVIAFGMEFGNHPGCSG